MSLADGQLAGYEACARQILPDGSVSTPAAFLLDADKSDAMSEVDMLVMDRTLDGLRRLPAPLHLAVNISASTLARNEYAQLMAGRLEDCGVDPSRLHLELNEAVLLGTSGSVRTAIRDLAEFGVRWYVDDFGTGYSSISGLSGLPIAGLKLGQSCIAGIGSGDASGKQLVRALAVLGECLGLDTVAQGVETKEQAEMLRAQGWQHGQGPLYGLPTPDLERSWT